MPTPVLDSQPQIFDFKGLNTLRPADLIEDEEFAQLTNLLVRNGRIQKRPGAQLVATVPFATYGQVQFMGIDIGRPNAYATFYFWSPSTSDIIATQDLVNYTIVSGALAVTDVQTPIFRGDFDFNPAFGGPYFGGTVGGVTGIYALELFINAPGNPQLVFGLTSSYGDIFIHQDRFWFVSGANINFSDPGDYTTLTVLGTGTITLTTWIDAAIPLDDKIILVCLDGLYVLNLQGTPKNWSLRKIKSFSSGYDKGQDSYKETTTAIAFDDAVYFINPHGFFKTNGVELVRLDDPIQGEFDEISQIFTSMPTLSVFNYKEKELILKITGNLNDDVANKIKYFVYNTLNNTWAKIEWGLTVPPGAPIFSSIISPIGDYTYDLVAFHHLYGKAHPEYPAVPVDYATSLDSYNFQRGLQGWYAMSNSDTTEDNKLYFIPEFEDLWGYEDDGNPYESILKTKKFDFGFRGINKKCNKMYLSLRDNASNIVATHYVNGVAQTPVDIAQGANARLVKLAGPGYFQEYQLELKDDTDNIADWGLDTLGFDLFNKSEQMSNIK